MKKEILKDGTEVTIKKLTLNDLDRMMQFYGELPVNDRKYFRVDVTKRDVVEQRIKQTKQGTHFTIGSKSVAKTEPPVLSRWTTVLRIASTVISFRISMNMVLLCAAAKPFRSEPPYG